MTPEITATRIVVIGALVVFALAFGISWSFRGEPKTGPFTSKGAIEPPEKWPR